MRKIFISHSSKDTELADSIQTLIETGIGLPHNEVFCTSLDGLGIPAGVADFKEYIRQEMQDCEAVVALISRNYYDSPFCMCELGAVWVQAKNFFPILVPPVDFKDLRGALTGMQCMMLTNESTASALYDRLSKLIANPVPIIRWDVKRGLFYKNLDGVLSRLPKPTIVKAEELDRMRTERDQIKAVSLELQEECDLLKREKTEIAALKDAQAVAKVRKKYSSEWDQYKSLRRNCVDAVRALPRIIQESLYYWNRGEAFEPNFDRSEQEVKTALEDALLTEHPFEEYKFAPNDERPKIKHAMSTIKALRRFLEKDSSEQFHKEANEEFGDTADFQRRSFWENELGLAKQRH